MLDTRASNSNGAEHGALKSTADRSEQLLLPHEVNLLMQTYLPLEIRLLIILKLDSCSVHFAR